VRLWRREAPEFTAEKKSAPQRTQRKNEDTDGRRRGTIVVTGTSLGAPTSSPASG